VEDRGPSRVLPRKKGKRPCLQGGIQGTDPCLHCVPSRVLRERVEDKEPSPVLPRVLRERLEDREPSPVLPRVEDKEPSPVLLTREEENG